MTNRSLGALLVAATLAAAILFASLVPLSKAANIHLANADDVSTVLRGKPLYMRYCASCHGRSLQGQPLWELIDKYAGRRAPAHDETGHTWQHSDEDIFHMTKYGRFAATPPDTESYMPGFGNVLRDDDILAVIAFIKARWPLGLRVSQSLLNPGYAGMPRDADKVEWRLPPTCNVLLQRSRAAAARGNQPAARNFRDAGTAGP